MRDSQIGPGSTPVDDSAEALAVATLTANTIRSLRGDVAELTLALEQTIEALHHEEHSVYGSWRVCDDSRCRRAAELI